VEVHIEDAIAAPLEAVEALVLDRRSLQRLSAVSPVGYRATLVSYHEAPGEVERVARFEVRGLRSLTGVPLVPDHVIWTDCLRWLRSEHAASFTIDPQVNAWLHARIICRGDYRLARIGAEGTRRSIDGVVRVDVPVVGAVFERAIVGLLERHFAAEARFLSAHAVPAPSPCAGPA
jgi:hypothetical protein